MICFVTERFLAADNLEDIIEFFNCQDVEELMSLPPEKILLRWMNFQLKKGGYKKTVTNFSSDIKVKMILNFLIYKCFTSEPAHMFCFPIILI